jgi:hypothetical protein
MALRGHANHLMIAQSNARWDEAGQHRSIKVGFQFAGTMPDAQAIRFLTTFARSEPVSVRL